jgi:hypothetical protein
MLRDQIIARWCADQQIGHSPGRRRSPSSPGAEIITMLRGMGIDFAGCGAPEPKR